MRLLLAVLSVCIAFPSAAKCPPKAEADFKAALAARDEARIYAATSAARACLGDPAHEEPERYENPFRLMKQPEGEELDDRIDEYWNAISPRLWWELRDPPTGEKALSALRLPAAVLRGAAMATTARARDAQSYRRFGELAAAYLMLAQKQGGRGVYPTPAWEGPARDRVRGLTDRFVKQARKDGVLNDVVRNGWIVDDRDGGGDLQFDNGLSGEAILAWHAVAPKPEYLESARAAGDWAVGQPLSPNFNYNGFSAAFLARLGAATGNKTYTDEAVLRVRLGVLPGMIAEGPFSGHWIDPHNTRLVYRLIMIRQMAVVAASLPKGNADRAFVVRRLQIALDAAEDQQRDVRKIAHWDLSAKAYCELAELPEIKSKSPDVRSLVRDAVLVASRAIAPGSDPHAFECALTIQPGYPNPQYPWETTLWPK